MAFIYKKTSEELCCGGFDFQIHDDYHYIKIGATNVSQLKKAGILPDKTYTNLSQNKPDGILLKGKNTVKVLIEYKKDGKISNEKEALAVITDWYFKLAKLLGCNVICACDGINTYWFNANKDIIQDESGNVLRYNLQVPQITENSLTQESQRELASLIQKFDNIDDNAQLKPEVILNPQNLANNVWQKIWISTGKEPEKCLYNVVEIFIFKFLSDLGILQDTLSFSHIYELSQKDKNLALETYANNIRDRIRKMFPKGSDGTTVINGTIFVNERGEPNLAQANLFQIVLSEFATYDKKYGSFKNIDKQFKTRLYESFLRQSAGISALGQYFTPRNVVISIINMINPESISENAKICDPFCGVGGFLLELINQIPKIKEQFKPINEIIAPKVELVGYDKGSDEKDDERTIILAKANMLIYFSDLLVKNTNCMKEFSEKAFNKVFHLLKTNLGTFGLDSHKEYFDLIITNPPYVTSGTDTVKKEINDKGLSHMYPSNAQGLEGLALEWIINALKPNGQTFVIIPDGLLHKQANKKLRDTIIDKCYINAIISLPSRTFFATPKKTYILALKKKNKPTKQTTPVFTYLISEIGETKDAKRFEIEENNLTSMSKLYRQFMAIPNDFNTEDLRCKIQDISKFEQQHWLIDRDWSDEEKKNLGITDSISEITEDDFSGLLKEIGNSILDFSKQKTNSLKELNTEIKFKTVELADENLFSVEIGERITKKELHNKEKGLYPAYSANVFEPFGWVSNLSIKTFEVDSVIWGIDGNWVTRHIPLNTTFVPTDHCGILRCKNPLIDMKFISYMLYIEGEKMGFSRSYRASIGNIKKITISIPVKNDGSFDLDKQKEISKKYQDIEKKKKQAIDMLKRLQETQVKIVF